MKDISKNAELSPGQEARIAAIVVKHGNRAFPKADSGAEIDFRPLFLAEPIDPMALRRYFQAQDAMAQASAKRSAEMMAEIRAVFTPTQRERIAAFLLAHPDPFGGPSASAGEASRSNRPAAEFGTVFGPLLEGVSLTAEQQQRVAKLQAAFEAGAAPKEADFYPQRIVAFLRDRDVEAHLESSGMPGRSRMPVDEILEAVSSLDHSQREAIIANGLSHGWPLYDKLLIFKREFARELDCARGHSGRCLDAVGTPARPCLGRR